MKIVLLLCAPLIVLVSCFGPAPGHGAMARVGFRAADQIVAALDRFQSERGHYPQNPKELVPRYLSSLDAFVFVRNGSDPRSILYRREQDGSFSLIFSYVSGFPSGMNTCAYDSKSRCWHSSGYY